MASDWESLAPRLRIDDPRSIKNRHPNDSMLCLNEVIRHWIHKVNAAATWEKLATEVSKVDGFGEGTKQAILDLAKGGGLWLHFLELIDMTLCIM